MLDSAHTKIDKNKKKTQWEEKQWKEDVTYISVVKRFRVTNFCIFLYSFHRSVSVEEEKKNWSEMHETEKDIYAIMKQYNRYIWIAKKLFPFPYLKSCFYLRFVSALLRILDNMERYLCSKCKKERKKSKCRNELWRRKWNLTISR